MNETELLASVHLSSAALTSVAKNRDLESLEDLVASLRHYCEQLEFWDLRKILDEEEAYIVGPARLGNWHKAYMQTLYWKHILTHLTFVKSID